MFTEKFNKNIYNYSKFYILFKELTHCDELLDT